MSFISSSAALKDIEEEEKGKPTYGRRRFHSFFECYKAKLLREKKTKIFILALLLMFFKFPNFSFSPG